jgi:proline iminopeptidase
MKTKLFTANIVLHAIAATILIASCKKELTLDQPGNLVPKTVDHDPTLPAISVNGTRLHSEAFGNPNDPMVIYLHGGPGSDYRNGLQAKQLIDNGYYVVFYDQRGSGLSKRHDKNTYSLQLMLDDLTSVINHYRTATGQKVFLLGHSWGAMLATAYVNSYPSRISGIILAEPGGFTDEMVEEYGEISRKINLLSESNNDAIYLDQFLTGDENDHEILDYKISLVASHTYSKNNIEGIEGPSLTWRNGAVILNSFIDLSMNEGFDFTQNLNQYTPKVLFLYSELNKAYGLQHAQRLAGYFSNVTITEIPDTGHEMIYFKWNTVYPLVLNYLNSLK